MWNNNKRKARFRPAIYIYIRMLSIMSFARHYPSSLTVNIINAHIIRLIIMLLQSLIFSICFLAVANNS